MTLWFLLRIPWAVMMVDIVQVFFGWTSAIVYGLPSLILCKLLGKELVLQPRSGMAPAYLSLYRWFLPPLLRLATRVVVPSRYLHVCLSPYIKNLRLVPNVLDTRAFTRKVREFPKSANLLVSRSWGVGSWIYGYELILKAFRVIREAKPSSRLFILGDGVELPKVKKLAEELGESIVFPGQVSREQIPRYFREADIYVNASYWDNLPNALLEAMAEGLPMVTTPAGGIPYMVEDGESAIIVPPDDHQALADAILRLLSNSQLYRRLSAAGLSAYPRLVWDIDRRGLSQALFGRQEKLSS